MKFQIFFLFLWVIFALLDPDAESGYGSTDLIQSGSESVTQDVTGPKTDLPTEGGPDPNPAFDAGQIRI
jgi:hypothetical protein